MANKLYEENAISDIASAIRKINGKSDSYTVAEMGDAIRGIGRVVYKGRITEVVKGSGVYAVLAKDSFLAEHRADETLFVRVEFDVEPAPYTIVKNWASAVAYEVIPDNYTQYAYRYNGNGETDIRKSTSCVFTNDSPDGVGSVLISEDGELRIYSNSTNFAIRPSAYTVIVEY